MTRSISARLRRARFAVPLIGVALLAVACLPAPINPDNRPTTIPNAQNGYIGDDSLRAATPTCEVWREAAASMGSMLAAAKRDGVQLATEECYRDYAGQVEMRNWWCYVGSCQMAAVPGRSNHGWAKAADLADQTGELTFESVGYAWLKAHASEYGWNHPGSMEPDGSVPEPWHWEWVGDGGQMYPGQYFGIGDAASLPAGGSPTGSLDVARGSVTGANVVRVGGWTIDPETTASTDVNIYVDGVKKTAVASLARADVASTYPAWGAKHGFDVVLSATRGSHHVCVWAMNKVDRGVNIQLGCRDIVAG